MFQRLRNLLGHLRRAWREADPALHGAVCAVPPRNRRAAPPPPRRRMCFSIIAGPTPDGTEPSWADKSGHDRADFFPMAPMGMMTEPAGRRSLLHALPAGSAQAPDEDGEIIARELYYRSIGGDHPGIMSDLQFPPEFQSLSGTSTTTFQRRGPGGRTQSANWWCHAGGFYFPRQEATHAPRLWIRQIFERSLYAPGPWRPRKSGSVHGWSTSTRRWQRTTNS